MATVLTIGVVHHRLQGEIRLTPFGGFGFDTRDRLVIEAGLRTHVGFSHRDELDVEVLDQRKVLGGVERNLNADGPSSSRRPSACRQRRGNATSPLEQSWFRW